LPAEGLASGGDGKLSAVVDIKKINIYATLWHNGQNKGAKLQ